jgi:hypothetical protein
MIKQLLEWYDWIVGSYFVVIAGALWLAKIEFNLNALKGSRSVGECETLRQGDGEALSLQLQNITSEIKHLREIVEIYHKDVMDRVG